MSNKGVIRFIAGYVYMRQSVPVDRLPYTPQLAEMTRRYNRYTKQTATERDLYLCLQNLRKTGGLPKKGRAT